MFDFKIGGRLVAFTKFFSAADRDAATEFAYQKEAMRAVFIDTPATPHLVEAVESLLEQGVEVVVRDHHDVEGEPSTDRDRAIRTAADRLRELLGGNARISTRRADPACSSLVKPGEFSRAWTVVVADPDPDGLLGAMKALGVDYPGLDWDAAIMDGPRAQQQGLTPFGELLVKGLATLPPYNPQRPEVAENAKAGLFQSFVAAVQGDSQAKALLESRVAAYEAGVREAERLAATAAEPVAGVVMVDTCGQPRYDLATLAQGLEALPGCRVTVVRKDQGPIAAKHGGVQYSLAVVKAHQSQINLQGLLPAGFESSPEAGIISNTSFLLHVSEAVWKEVILPALRTRMS